MRRYYTREPVRPSHYLIDPVACTPASGREKGQVENQVGLGSNDQFSSGAPSKISRVQIGTRIDPAGFFHKRFQPRPRHLAMSDIPERSRPFADRLAVGALRGAANGAIDDVGGKVLGKPIDMLVADDRSRSASEPQS